MEASRWVRRALGAYVAIAVAFLTLPQLVVIAVSFNNTPRMVVPGTEWSLQWYKALLASDGFGTAFLLSFAMAPLVAVAAVLLGGAAAYGVTRFAGRGTGLVQALFVAPLLLPVTALAVGMFLFFHTLGLTNTIWAVAISHVVIAIPYAFRTLLAAVGGVDRRLEEAAMSLGATRARAIRRVTVPLITPGISAAALFCLIVSLDEITVTLFVGAREVKTIPIQIFDQTEYGLDPTVAAASTVLIVVSALVILLLNRTIGLRRAYSLGK